MADSSKSTELGKPSLGANKESAKESKKKLKRSKKLRAKSNENLESKTQECSALVRDDQNVVENYEHYKTNMGENSLMVETKEEFTANIDEEVSTPEYSEKMATGGTKHGDKNNEEFINKGVQQVSKMIEESSGEQQEDKPELAKQDQTDAGKKSKRPSINLSLRSKRNSKSKLSSGEDKQVEDMAAVGECSGVETKRVARKEEETNEQQEEIKDEAKVESGGANSADMKSKDEDKTPEGIHGKSRSKGNKGKKLKQLASSGRNKKRADIAIKRTEDEIPDSDTHELKESSPVRSERTGSNPENVTDEPVIAGKNESTNECVNTVTEEENGKKDAGKAKRKGSFLSLKRSKHHTKKRKSATSEDEPSTNISESEKISASKESDDVSIMEAALVEKAATAITEKEKISEFREEREPNAAKTADLLVEETSEAALTKESQDKDEMSSPERKEHGEPAAEETSQVSTKKERKSSILRSLRKLKSPNNKSQHGKKKPHENEKSVEANEDNEKKVEQSGEGETFEPKQSTAEQKSAEETSEECADGMSKAVKRKTSDLKNIGRTRALKRKKEDNENTTDLHDHDERTEEETDLQNQHENEDISTSNAEENVKELTEQKEKCVDEFNFQANKELSLHKNNKEEQTANKERHVQDETPRETLTRDDTRDEEKVLNEAQEICRRRMKTVIDELVEFMEKKEAQRAKQTCAQVERTEENVERSNEETATTARESTVNQKRMSEVHDKDGENSGEQETEDESYDSDITVVSFERLPTRESAAEHKTEPKTEDEEIQITHGGESSETETTRVADAKVEGVTEPASEEAKPSSEIETPQATKPHVEHKTEPKEEDTKESSETATSQVTQSPVGRETVHTTEVVEQSSPTETIQVTEPPVTSHREHKTETKPELSENETSQVTESLVKEETAHKTEDAELSSEAETSRDLESRVEQETEPKAEESSEADTPQDLESQVQQETEPKAEESSEADTPQDLESQVQLETEPKAEESSEADTSQGLESQVQQETEPKTEDMRISDSKAADKTESNADYDEMRVSNEAGSQENVISEAVNDDPKIENLLQGRVVEVLLTEQENNDGVADVEVTRKGKKQEEKKGDEGDQEISDSFSNNSSTWIMVQHVKMNEEISRQLGHMLMINAFKRTTSCCTIM